MPRLVLHAGGPKTASSYLQVILAQEAEELKKNGIIVPMGRETNAAKNKLITSGNGLELANFLDPSLRHIGESREQVPDQIGSVLDAAEGQTVVYSSEFLDCPVPSRMKKICALAMERNYEVEFIIYVRNVDAAAYSFYSQSVKRHNDTREFEQFIEIWRPPYLERIDRVAKCMSKDSIKVFNYERYAENIAKHFFETVLNVSMPYTDGGVVNRSLTFGELNLLRRMNSQFPKNNSYSTFISDAIIYASPANQNYDFSLSTREAERLEELFSEGTSKLNTWLGENPISVISSNTTIGPRREHRLTDFENVMLAILTRLVKIHVDRTINERRVAAQSKVQSNSGQ